MADPTCPDRGGHEFAFTLVPCPDPEARDIDVVVVFCSDYGHIVRVTSASA